MNVLLYARVSTEGQTLDPQWLELRGHCARNGWTVLAEYSDVLSGAKAARPGLDAMIERCAAGGVGAVVCVKLDRIGRSVLNVVGLIERLEKMGVGVICPGQGIDTRKESPCGRMQYQIIAAVAEFERSMIRERTRAGLAVARANGKALGRRSTRAGTDAARVVIVAAWRAETGGKSVRDLARRLGGCSPTTAARLARENPPAIEV